MSGFAQLPICFTTQSTPTIYRQTGQNIAARENHSTRALLPVVDSLFALSLIFKYQFSHLVQFVVFARRRRTASYFRFVFVAKIN